MNPKKLPSLSYKLYTNFVISFILPIILICIFISYLFSNYQYQGVKNQTADNAQLIHAYLTRYIGDIDNIMKAPYYSSYFQSKTSFNELSTSEKNSISSDIDSILRLTTYSREDFGDLLFLSDGEILYFNAENYYQYLPSNQPLINRNWYIDALDKDGKIAIVPDTETTASKNFFISRKLKNLYKQDQENVIMVSMNGSTLNEIFSELSNLTPGMIVFTNDKNELIYSNSPIDDTLLQLLDQEQFQYEQNTWMHCSETMEEYPLTIHVMLSTSYITKQITAFIFVSIICYMIGLLISYLLFQRNNKWIKDPVLHIQSVLKEMKKGNLYSRCENMDILEFDNIGTAINGMAHRLQEKIKNEYELSIAQKNLQFQALQSQIQPHFIINTIYSFITLNQIGETELLNDAFYSFAHLLRYVLNRDNNTTLEKELDFLNNYCSLHQLRFGHRIRFEISCDETLHSLVLPKLILQPLVENAVIHGIEPSETPCFLEISAKKYQDTVYLIIEDNGVGFTTEQLSSPTSIGIKNVETRIRIWNEYAKLYIYRIDGRSIQTIIIPMPTQGEEENEDTCYR